MSLLRTIFLLPLLAIQSQPPAPQVPTDDDLNPKRAHIQIMVPFENREPPRLALYATPRLTGDPVITLNGEGLFIRGKLACTWRGGTFEGPSPDDIPVLASADAAANEYRWCAPGLPIRSIWHYEEGGRSSHLLIEVAARRGTLIETRQGRTRYYFDLNSLQGDPVDDGDPVETELRRVVRLKGVTGWSWNESKRDIDRREAKALAALLKDRTFTTFLRDIRACLSSSKVPGCLVPFVKREHPGAVLGEASLDSWANAEEFVDFVWQQLPESGAGAGLERRPWDELVACLFTRGMRGASKDGVTLETDTYICDVERIDGAWKFASILHLS